MDKITRWIWKEFFVDMKQVWFILGILVSFTLFMFGLVWLTISNSTYKNLPDIVYQSGTVFTLDKEVDGIKIWKEK